MTISEGKAIYAVAKALYYKYFDKEIRIRCLKQEEYFHDLHNYEKKIKQNRIEHKQQSKIMAERAAQIEQLKRKQ